MEESVLYYIRENHNDFDGFAVPLDSPLTLKFKEYFNNVLKFVGSVLLGFLRGLVLISKCFSYVLSFLFVSYSSEALKMN